MRTIGIFFVCLTMLVWPAFADDIILERGKFFSIYSPASCRRVEQPSFALVLGCNFHDKGVQFYLKEFPGQLSAQFDPRKNPPPKLYQMASPYLRAAVRAIVDDIEPVGMSERIIFFGGGSNSDDTNTLFWQEGYLFKGSESVDKAEKCILLRVQSYSRGLTAVLIAFNDFDAVVLHSGRQRCEGIPREVPTILGSLGGNFLGGRFMQRP